MLHQGQKKLLSLFHDDPDLRLLFPLFEELFKDSHLGTGARKSISDILDEIIDKINSSDGYGSDMNFYPSDKKGSCKKTCLGIATKGYDYKRDEKRNRTGFKGLIKDIVKYWITCGSVNQLTVLLTTEWRQKAFNDDWIAIVDAYVGQGKKVIIIEFGDIDSYIIRYR